MVRAAVGVSPDRPEKIPASLTGVAETLLITLHARATDAVSRSPVLGDAYAASVKARLDHDWSRTHSSSWQTSCIALRAKAFDDRTRAFLDAHAASAPLTVLHLACGLDGRARRVHWPTADGKDVSWIDVDLPRVVALRKKLMPPTDFETAPDGLPRNYSLMAADLTKDDWLAAVPADRKTIVVAEGLLPYLSPEDVKKLLVRLVRHLAPGGELVFDFTTWVAVQMQSLLLTVRRTGAVVHWSLDNPKDVEGWDQQLKLLGWERVVDLPGSQETTGFAWWWIRTAAWTPLARDALKIGRFSF